MKAAEDGNYLIKTIKPLSPNGDSGSSVIVDKVVALASGEELHFKEDEAGLHISCPVKSEFPVVFKLVVR